MYYLKILPANEIYYLYPAALDALYMAIAYLRSRSHWNGRPVCVSARILFHPFFRGQQNTMRGCPVSHTVDVSHPSFPHEAY